MAKGKQTARSQAHRDALAQYGYPSQRTLRREAKHIARASVPTVRSIERPYDRQLQSARDFLAAVRSALSDTGTATGGAYDQALAQSQAVNTAAENRLAGLGLGDYSTSGQAVSGAIGDSAAQQLISNAASAREYAAKLPGIAAGNASVEAEGLRKQQQDALQNRRDQLRQSFWQALPQVQGQALQRASFNQSADQFTQNLALQREQMAQAAQQAAINNAQQDRAYAEGVREFNIGQRASARQNAFSNRLQRSQFRAQYGYDPITGKSSAAATAMGPLAQYSPSQLASIARQSADQLAPTHSVRTTQRDKQGRSVGSTSHIVHDIPPAYTGQDFQTTVAAMIRNGVPEQVALWQANRMYEAMGNVQSAAAMIAAVRQANGQKIGTIKQFEATPYWAEMQQAYYTWLQEQPSVYSGNPRG